MNSQTDLIEIVAAGDFSSLQARFSAEPNLHELINLPMDCGDTTLLHLAANSTADILCFLLDANADPCCQTEDGLTPLHIAAMWGRKELVSKLLSYGGDLYAVDNEGLRPIDYARNEGHLECAELLDSESDKSLSYTSSSNGNLDQTCAESFVDMFETLALYGDTSTTSYPDVVEDTLQATMDEYYETALSSLDSSLHTPADTDTTSNGASASPASPNTSAYTTVLTPESTSSFQEMQTTVSPEIVKLSDSQLRERLISLGEQPGPVNEFTRKAYMVYLTKLESSGISRTALDTACEGFRYELALVLNGISPLPNMRHLEEEVVCEFRTPPSLTASRAPVRDNFNYLLLDSRKFEESILDQSFDDLSQFRQFAEAVFYVGKGKNSRPMQHLKDAKTALSRGGKLNSKLDRIATVWEQGCGVISLPIFHHTHEGEAFTRECCMIEAFGLDNLTNQVRGHVHGAIRDWPVSKRRQYGVYLLYKAFKVFKLTRPPQIRQQDL